MTWRIALPCGGPYTASRREPACAANQIAQTVERTGSSDPLPFARVHHGAGGKELFEVDVDIDAFQWLSKGCEELIGPRVEEHWPDEGHVTGSCRFRLLPDPPLSGSRRLPCLRALMQPASRGRAHITAPADATRGCVPNRSAPPGQRLGGARQVHQLTHSERDSRQARNRSRFEAADSSDNPSASARAGTRAGLAARLFDSQRFSGGHWARIPRHFRLFLHRLSA